MPSRQDGYGFVTFADPGSVIAATSDIGPHVVDGVTLVCTITHQTMLRAKLANMPPQTRQQGSPYSLSPSTSFYQQQSHTPVSYGHVHSQGIPQVVHSIPDSSWDINAPQCATGSPALSTEMDTLTAEMYLAASLSSNRERQVPISMPTNAPRIANATQYSPQAVPQARSAHYLQREGHLHQRVQRQQHTVAPSLPVTYNSHGMLVEQPYMGDELSAAYQQQYVPSSQYDGYYQDKVMTSGGSSIATTVSSALSNGLSMYTTNRENRSVQSALSNSGSFSSQGTTNAVPLSQLQPKDQQDALMDGLIDHEPAVSESLDTEGERDDAIPVNSVGSWDLNN